MKVKVDYLGHVVGHKVVTPIKTKVKSIIDYPFLKIRKRLMWLLEIAGYHRKFCKKIFRCHCSTNRALEKLIKYHWSEVCQRAFDKVKKNFSILEPVLTAADFSKQFWLAMDTMDFGVGAVLL